MNEEKKRRKEFRRQLRELERYRDWLEVQDDIEDLELTRIVRERYLKIAKRLGMKKRLKYIG